MSADTKQISFKDRRLIIATKHGKESVIAPIVEKYLGAICFVDENFDTDLLGTFTGEIERKHDVISTVREKCLKAMELNHCELGIASEGSFGPHPMVFFSSADEEFLIFIDKKNNLEIIVRELSTETNFSGKSIKNVDELLQFANSVHFPSHAMILRKSPDENDSIFKGINDISTLKDTFNKLSAEFHEVYAETDMRAMYNPSRMKVIENAAKKLVEKINSLCPECKMPGFGITSSKKGLPCSSCHRPTRSVLSYISVCKHCDFSDENKFPHDIMVEDPMYCDHCNP
ncbi:hypothetical protein IV494_08955 [Kaistella sp. G5-32]|uniref:DUF6671 domain-containing protein n=1 Tax=Kaistella gelatinilytica TaxID=2787636 RepID=A0ABS0FC82_9FLAO|nr:DUF6671 family protein [Kaistella gelatinilytica]MBF8457311.1 hypothetical protein [Kaistella gelatinilytica]